MRDTGLFFISSAHITYPAPEMNARNSSTGIPAALNYVNCLRNAISRNDLITIRRHEKAEFYKSSFKECRERLEKEDSEKNAESEQKSKSMLPLGQLSLMDLFEL